MSGDRRGGPPRRDGGRGGPRPDLREPKRVKLPKPEIVHRGAGILVANKKPGMPVRGDGELTLRNCVHELAFARRDRMRPWHEIEALASGAVAFITAIDRDDLEVPDSKPEVTYLALVEGEYGDESVEGGTSINAPIEGSTSRGNPVTHVRVIAQGNGAALVQVRARPDIPNQVRQHLAQTGHAIIGDTDFGATRDDVGRFALHSYEVRFRELETGKVERVRVPAPRGWWDVVGATPASGMATEIDDQKKDDEGWGEVAGWYDELISSRGSDHHERVILPGLERLVDLKPGERLIDIACGQGVAARHLIGACPGATALGVDLSSELIERAKGQSPESIDYLVGDARELGSLGLERFDAACCVMALMNIDPIDGVLTGAHSVLKDSGRLVSVILHPSFRNQGATFWGWLRDERTGRHTQYRRVDRYMSSHANAIVMNPGAVSDGADAVTTMTHHRPIGVYIQKLAQAGFVVDSIEEWVSDRRSEPGPRAVAENIARAEIPMFCAIRAIKR
jgi:ubiquinone/menaquinone biosynthesis C-methylase UbiE/23S rRNA-/tRNA-specific pseudouridylate synthase